MATRTIVQPWLISKWFDPIFAISMGFSAAALRVKRESIEKNPNEDNSYGALWQKGKLMSKSYFGYEK